MTWADQMSALVSLPDNCETKPGWDECSWSIETLTTELLSVSFLMDSDFFPFFVHYLLLSVPNIHDVQRGKSSFKYKNIDGRNPSFSSLNMDLICRWDNLSCQYLNLFCKGDNTSGNMILSIFLVW